MTLTPLPPDQTHKPKSGRAKHKESALLINGGRLQRATTKEKHVFSILVLEFAPKSHPTTLQNSVQPLIKDFEDVFPQELPLVFLRKGVLNNRLT